VYLHSPEYRGYHSCKFVYWLPIFQGSPANWEVGTPSSRSLLKAAEKLLISIHQDNPDRVYLLLEELLLALGVLGSVGLEGLVLDQSHIGAVGQHAI
jgi:hypothetical protein